MPTLPMPRPLALPQLLRGLLRRWRPETEKPLTPARAKGACEIHRQSEFASPVCNTPTYPDKPLSRPALALFACVCGGRFYDAAAAEGLRALGWAVIAAGDGFKLDPRRGAGYYAAAELVDREFIEVVQAALRARLPSSDSATRHRIEQLLRGHRLPSLEV